MSQATKRTDVLAPEGPSMDGPSGARTRQYLAALRVRITVLATVVVLVVLLITSVGLVVGQRGVLFDILQENGPLTADEREDVDESTGALVVTLAVVLPLVVAVLAGFLWWLVGRTLRPVEESTRRQQRFVADASHELRTPLTRMRAELEVSLAHPYRGDPLEVQRSVLAETVGMQRLVEDLLLVARSDALSPSTMAREVVDLDDVVLGWAGQLHHDGRVRVDMSDVSAAQVRGDAAQLSRVLGNLADNALRHAESEVRFTLAERDGRAVLTVSDDGPGIPPEHHERIFERFSRLDDARTARTGGVGLGLAIARDIVVRHCGRLTVDPDHRPGARFVVTLPVAR